MIRWSRLAAALALGAGLTVAGAVLAQSQSGSDAPAAGTVLPAPPPDQSTTLPTKSWDSDATQPVYSVSPPPGSSQDLDLPTAVGGYARSVAGCVVIGCDDGPQVRGPSGTPSSAPGELPEPWLDPRPSEPH